MPSFSSQQVETLLKTQTRMIPLPDGHARLFTGTMLVWLGYEYLVDRRYCTPERLVQLANIEGWDPPTPSFEDRLEATIAYWTRRYDAAYRDYTDYCRGRL
jgi:hypothetical protein